MRFKQKRRLYLVTGILVCGAAVILISLYRIQIIKGDEYRLKADKQYIKPQVNLFERGSIFYTSKDGTKLAAATVAEGYLLYMNPSIIANVEETYKVISQYFKIDKDIFVSKASKSDDKYEELGHKVDPSVASSITSLGIPGISALKETWRSYPAKDLSSQTIGLVGESGTGTTTISGRYGLEKYYNQVLRRENSGTSVGLFAELFGNLPVDTIDNMGDGSSANIAANSINSKTITIAGNTFDTKPGDITTSLEPTVSTYVDKILSETVSEWKPDEIGAIVIEPKTGRIIAAVESPSFDPNNTKIVKNVKLFSNPLVENVYEMGSIMKPLTMAMALDSGAVSKSFTYNDTGTMTLDTKTFSNYDGKARGVTDLQQILSQSLNIGAATIALKVGKEKAYSYFHSYGFGSKTGVDLPNEATGLMNNLKNGKDIDLATASYGQGIAMSPISITRALSLLANNGKITIPHIVDQINFDDGTRVNVDTNSTQVIKSDTAEEVTRMLVEVVDKALKQGQIKHENYSIAAKTGTAQIPDHVNGGYYKDKYLHSFFGYFPAYSPKFLVFLYQVNPKGAKYASETLTDPFDKIATFLIDYYNIPPDR
jgi:cell division protein FtsI/penicillin-binding protein 2